MNHVDGRYAAYGLLLVLHVTSAEALEVAAGSYAIESQMVLPHMEEMRRTSKYVQVCIDGGNVVGMFPIFSHPALKDCTLQARNKALGAVDFLLSCPGINGARGTAQLVRDGDKFKGELHAKLGGKNMTFVQYVEARRSGPCE